MSGSPGRSVKKYPLHMTMSAVFTTLLVIFGLALIAFNFTRARSAAFREADNELSRFAEHLSTNVAEL